MKIQAHTITLKVQTTLSESGLRVMAEQLAKLAETVPSASHALIVGNRSNHPRHGAHSDLMVKFSDGSESGPFGYYADAYQHASEAGVAPCNISRNGSKARRA